MKILMTLLMALVVTSVAQARNLNADTPSNYFLNNPDAVQDFIAHVNDSSNLTDEEKTAYIALVDPNQKVSGDEVLELIDEETLRWYYGSAEDVSNDADDTNSLLKKAALVSEGQDVISCMMKTLCVHVSKAHQRMYAFYNGRPISGIHNTPVSTARRGKWTPTGTFSIGELAHKGRVSGRYDGATLGWAMQLAGHIFIHATAHKYYPKLGKRASAGCVRTTFAIAGPLNKLMREVGGRVKRDGVMVMADTSNVRVVVTAH